MDDDFSSDEKNKEEPTYKPAYQPQYPQMYYNSNIPNNTQIQNPYSIPDNPYGIQIDPAENNSYSYSYNPGVPPDYYDNYDNSQPFNYAPNTLEATNNSTENVAQYESPITSNHDNLSSTSNTTNTTNNTNTNNTTNATFSIPPPPPPPQYIYDPDAPNCRVVENDRQFEVEDNEETDVQNSLKQCWRCFLKCFCSAFILIICIAVISSFLFG